MLAASDIDRPRLRTWTRSVYLAADATSSPASMPRWLQWSSTSGAASSTVTASTPVRTECSYTGTHTRTAPSRSAVTTSPVWNARPARVAATDSSTGTSIEEPSTSGWRISCSKSIR